MNFLNIFRGTGKNLTKPDKRQKIVVPVDSFAKWSSHHRDHQKNAIAAMSNATTGQCSIPTGTGKTRVQVHLQVENMLKQMDNRGVYVIASHRLALNKQLLNDLVDVAANASVPFDLLFIGADQFNESRLFERFKHKLTKKDVEVTSTTRGDAIREAYDKSQIRKRHLVIASTYQSCNRMDCLESIDMMTCDEAHTLVGNSMLDNLISIKPNIGKLFFFTATRRVQGDLGGMNRIDVFGEILYEESPRKMIDVGEIVPPKLHIIDTLDEGDYNNHTMLVKTVLTGFDQHKILVHEHSSDPDAIGAKLLISTTGNQEMMELLNDSSFKEHCKNNSIHVFAFSAEFGAFVNFEKKDREFVMEEMRGMTDSDDAILLHIEILTEGIDLPSITGVMPFRELNTTKMLQTIGRAARLLKTDRERLYSDAITACDYSAYVKPCCWIIIPRFFKSLGDSDTMMRMLKAIINSYEVPVEEYSTIDRYKAVSDEDADRITEFDKITRKERESDLTFIVEDIMLEQKSIMDAMKTPIKAVSSFFTKFRKQ